MRVPKQNNNVHIDRLHGTHHQRGTVQPKSVPSTEKPTKTADQQKAKEEKLPVLEPHVYLTKLKEAASALEGLGFGYPYHTKELDYLKKSPRYQEKEAHQKAREGDMEDLYKFNMENARGKYSKYLDGLEDVPNAWDVGVSKKILEKTTGAKVRNEKTGKEELVDYDINFNKPISEHITWFSLEYIALVKGKPSEALKDIAKNKTDWKFGCAMYQQILFHYAALLAYGPEEYDKRIANMIKQQLGDKDYRKLVIGQFKSTGFDYELGGEIPDAKEPNVFYKIKFPEDITGDISIEKRKGTAITIEKINTENAKGFLDKLPVGIVLALSSNVRKGDAWDNENFTKVDTDQYVAHPLEGGKPISYQKVREAVAKYTAGYNDGRKYFLSDVTYIKSSF